jgi:hypothetical protein
VGIVTRRAVERRPADDVERVDVAGPVDVGSGIDERAHDFHLTVRSSPVQRRGVVARLTRVWIGAVLQQRADDVDVPALRRFVQSRPASMRPRRVSGPHQTRICPQESTECSQISGRAGVEEPGHLVRLTLLDFCLQRAPAGKAVVARHQQQRCRQLGVRIGSAQVLQPILRQLLQILEGCTFGQVGGRHRPFLPSLPGVRVSGWKSGRSSSDTRLVGGFDPLRGPWAACRPASILDRSAVSRCQWIAGHLDPALATTHTRYEPATRAAFSGSSPRTPPTTAPIRTGTRAIDG